MPIMGMFQAEAPASHLSIFVSGTVGNGYGCECDSLVIQSFMGAFAPIFCCCPLAGFGHNKNIRRCFSIATNELMINEKIRDPQVRLISSQGEQLGIMDVRDAQRLADEENLDLVKISPGANPPVCKLMDYGKFRFDSIKREKEQRKNQKIVELKEIRLSATIDTHDMEVKAKNCIKFLKNGDKVKASIRFRGRQITKGSIGIEVMNTFFDMLEGLAVKEKPPKQEGRNMFMILAPIAPKN